MTRYADVTTRLREMERHPEDETPASIRAVARLALDDRELLRELLDDANRQLNAMRVRLGEETPP